MGDTRKAAEAINFARGRGSGTRGTEQMRQEKRFFRLKGI